MAVSANVKTYLLLVDFIGERHTRGERYKAIVINKGALLKGPKSNYSEIFSVRSGYQHAAKRKYVGATVQIPDGKQSSNVAPLSIVDYRLLKGVADDSSRYEVYISGRLQLNIGDNVFVKLTHLSDEPIAAVLRWKGVVHQKAVIPGLQFHDKELKFGVEIMDRRYCGSGDNSGRLNGVRYFQCKEKSACFVSWDEIYLPSHFDAGNIKWAVSTETLLSCLSQTDEATTPQQKFDHGNEGEAVSLGLKPEQDNFKNIGQSTTSQELISEWWEIPQEDIHISNTATKIGEEWGYISKGTLCRQQVTLKFFHREIITQLTTCQILQEIRTTAQIHHPHLILFMGAVFGPTSGPIIVTECIDKTLRSACRDQIVDESSKLPILRDIASALNYLHSHRLKVTHGDVNSNNVYLEALVNNRWKAKLSEFGSVHLIHHLKSLKTSQEAFNDDSLSMPKILSASESPSATVDINRFGVLICEVVFNVPPTDHPTPCTCIDVAQLQNDVHRQMYELAQNCTKSLPHRFPLMSQVLTTIDAVL